MARRRREVGCLTHPSYAALRNGNSSTSSDDDGPEVLIHSLRFFLLLSISSFTLPDRGWVRFISFFRSFTHCSYSSSSISSSIRGSLEALFSSLSSPRRRLLGLLTFLNRKIIRFLHVAYMNKCHLIVHTMDKCRIKKSLKRCALFLKTLPGHIFCLQK